MMYSRWSLATLLFLLPAISAFGQDTCRIFTIENPHGAGMDITRIWVVDTLNFSVESIRPIPFFLGATESFDIRVCIKARDGQSHTTQVRYQNTHGTSSYTVAMTAPSTTGVDLTYGVDETTIGMATPTPASTVVRIPLQLTGPMPVALRVYRSDGGLAHSAMFVRYYGDEVSLDVSGLPNGHYVAVIEIDDVQVLTREIVIAR